MVVQKEWTRMGIMGHRKKRSFKCSLVSVRSKPNGRARIMIGLSHCPEARLGKGQVYSPNDGMANYEGFEPVTMAL